MSSRQDRIESIEARLGAIRSEVETFTVKTSALEDERALLLEEQARLNNPITSLVDKVESAIRDALSGRGVTGDGVRIYTPSTRIVVSSWRGSTGWRLTVYGQQRPLEVDLDSGDPSTVLDTCSDHIKNYIKNVELVTEAVEDVFNGAGNVSTHLEFHSICIGQWGR